MLVHKLSLLKLTEVAMVISRERLEILSAAENNDLEAVEIHLSANPLLINAVDHDGYSALHRAAYNGHIDMIIFLMSNGANPNAVTVDGWTPAHCASRWNQSKCVEMLVDYGCNPNQPSAGGQTLLHIATQHGCFDVVKYLLLNPEVDILLKNNQDETAYDLSQRNSKMAPVFEAVDYTRVNGSSSNKCELNL